MPFCRLFGREKAYALYIFSFLLTFHRNPEAMKAATEEVNKTLENAGQKVSFDGSPVHLNQIQLDNMPVLGVLVCVFHVNFCVLLPAVVSSHHTLTCCRRYVPSDPPATLCLETSTVSI